MSPGPIKFRVISQRLALIDELLAEIHALPLEDQAEFLADRRNVWTAESCLRRILEALLDLGRHILAKGLAKGVKEYKSIASELGKAGILSAAQADLLRQMAGYRNRMVHFYDEITPAELFEICTDHLESIVAVQNALRRWLKANPDRLDEELY